MGVSVSCLRLLSAILFVIFSIIPTNTSTTPPQKSISNSGWECFEHYPQKFSSQWTHAICAVSPACFYDRHFVFFNRKCRNPGAVVNSGSEASRLFPVKCERGTIPQRSLARVIRETRESSALFRSHDWIKSRNSVVWWNGTTLLANLDKSSINVYHLVSKLMAWMYFHNISDQSLPLDLDRIFIRRNPAFTNVSMARGSSGPHSSILRAMIRSLLSSRKDKPALYLPRNVAYVSPEWILADDRIAFESSSDIVAASLHNPVCFERLVLPGCVRGTLYEGGPAQVTTFKNLLRKELRAKPAVQQPWNHKPRLLYVRRIDSKRSFDNESEIAFSGMLGRSEMTPVGADFRTMDFRSQVAAVESADVVIGIHGANFLNPSLLLRPGTVLIELFPYNFLWRGYANTSMASGGIHIGYMLDRGAQNPAEKSPTACYYDRKCLRQFRDVSTIHLTLDDVVTIEDMLALAARLAEAVRDARDRNGGHVVVDGGLVDPHIDRNCEEFSRDSKMSWVGYVDESTKKVVLCGLTKAKLA